MNYNYVIIYFINYRFKDSRIKNYMNILVKKNKIKIQ